MQRDPPYPRVPRLLARRGGRTGRRRRDRGAGRGPGGDAEDARQPRPGRSGRGVGCRRRRPEATGSTDGPRGHLRRAGQRGHARPAQGRRAPGRRPAPSPARASSGSWRRSWRGSTGPARWSPSIRWPSAAPHPGRAGTDAQLDPTAAGRRRPPSRALTGGRGVDVTLDCTSTSSGFGLLLRLAAVEGRIVIVGSHIGEARFSLFTEVQLKELSIVGAFQPLAPRPTRPSPGPRRRTARRCWRTSPPAACGSIT